MMNGEMGIKIVKEISEARMSDKEKEERRVKIEKVSKEKLKESEKEEKRERILNRYVMSDIQVGKLRMEVKKVMWKYYSENKSLFPEYVREFREEIIVELMMGESVEDVFDSFGGGEELLKAS